MEIRGTKVRYIYHFEGDEKRCEAVAKGFHETLQGNEDYVESRILLYWNSPVVELYEFNDSRTSVHVVDSDSGLPKLVLKPYAPIFWGLFFDEEAGLPKGMLEKKVEHKHVTFGYGKPMPAHLLGQKSTVIVVGYGNDGDNEALFVELDPDIQEYHDGGRADSPYHITLSTSENGNPVDSAKLGYWGVDTPYVLEGTFGYFAIVDGVPTVVTEKLEEQAFFKGYHIGYKDGCFGEGELTCYDTGEDRIFHCSNCGLGINDAYLNDEGKYGLDDDFPRFCPYCGLPVLRKTDI